MTNYNNSKIPKGWRLVKIKDFAETVSGGTPDTERREYYDNGNIPWIKSGELRNGRIKKFDNFITKKGLENSSAKLLPKKTVLVAMYGATAGQIGILEKEAATNQAICGILPNDEYDPEYLFNFLKTRTKHLLRISAGAAQPNISQEIIKNYYIKLPPLPEQKRIVAVLEVWDKYLELLKRKIEIKKNIKKGLMQRMFPKKDENVPELHFKEFSGPWEEKKLGEYLTQTKCIKKDDLARDKIITVRLHLKGVKKADLNKISTLKLGAAYCKRYYGEFIYGKQNIHNGALGLVPKELDGFYSSTDIPSFKISYGINPGFLYFYFARSWFYKQLERFTTGTGSKRLYEHEFLKLKIKLPSLPEQEKIAEVLTTTDKEIEALERKYKLIEEQRRYLLEKLVNGEIRVPENLVINN